MALHGLIIDNKDELSFLNCVYAGYLCMLLISSADFFPFSPKSSFRYTIIVSNGLDPYQGRHSVVPGLGQTRLQRLSADDQSRRSVLKTLNIKNETLLRRCIMQRLVSAFTVKRILNIPE